MSSTDESSTSTSVARNSAPTANTPPKSSSKQECACTSPRREFVTSEDATFSAHRLPRAAYIDKTGLIAKLVAETTGYFVNRPRKFGKSVLLDTIHAYFRGNREDFKGLQIYDEPVAWEECPVIRFSMDEIDFLDAADFSATWASEVREHARTHHDVTLEDWSCPSALFSVYIEEVYFKYKKGVVILIDEYDAPLLSCLVVEDSKLLRDIERILSSFYSVLKSQAGSGHVRFRYVTGITRLARDSLSPALNDLDSIDNVEKCPELATLCGFTEREIKTAYGSELKDLAALEGKTEKAYFKEIENLYNGYNWHLYGNSAALVYNPYAINCVFQWGNMEHYWAEPFLPSWLKRFLRSCDFVDVANILTGTVPWRGCPGDFAELFDTLDLDSVRLIMWECGLLNACFEGARRERPGKCRYPNKEVRSVVERTVLRHVKNPKAKQRIKFYKGAARMVKALQADKTGNFLKEIGYLVNMIPNVVFGKRGGTDEALYHAVIYTALYALPSIVDEIEFESEKTAAADRIDFVVYSRTTAYLVEIKAGGNLDDALAQIKEKDYSAFHGGLDGSHKEKRILAIAVSFDFQKDVKKVRVIHKTEELKRL